MLVGADCVERGFLLIPDALARFEEDLAGALERFVAAGEIAKRFQDSDLAAMANMGEGQARAAAGDRAGALPRLDEAMLIVSSGQVSPIVAGWCCAARSTPASSRSTASLARGRVDPDATAEGFQGRTALLSPFDRLVHDRVRALDLFDFECTLEMYQPKGKRRWGYFAFPVLHHDHLVGKVDATIDRQRARLHVHAIHEDVPFTRAMTDAVNAELDALVTWLGLDGVEGKKTLLQGC